MVKTAGQQSKFSAVYILVADVRPSGLFFIDKMCLILHGSMGRQLMLCPVLYEVDAFLPIGVVKGR